MAETLNMDFVDLWNRNQRFKREFQESQSANVSLSLAADVARWKSYLSSQRVLMQEISGLPDVDAPESNPRRIALRDQTPTLDVENESVQKLAVMIDIQSDELINSQSSRLAAGILSFDRKRFLDMNTKMENYLDNFVAVAEPLDLPESSPRAAVAPAGSRGIDPSTTR